MKKISVIGDGGWGTALALVLERNGHAVRVWGPFPEYIETIRNARENPKFLPGVPLPDAIRWTADRAEAVDGAEAVVFVVPSIYYRDTAASFATLIPPNALLLSATKGLDRETHHRMSETAEEALGREPVAALSGPSHAEEVAREAPSAVTLACRDHDRAVALQRLFSNPVFRVYSSDDVVGVELGGALKNIIALAAGICDGLGFGDNTKAALMTRGLAEMTRLGVALGARAETFSGLSGMGDLIVTCTSQLSRNRGVGERLGKGESMQEILESMEQAAEGVWNCANARALAAEVNIELPITDEVYAVLYENKPPREAVQALLTREPKPEMER